MDASYIIALILAILTMLYLGYVLIKPERF